MAQDAPPTVNEPSPERARFRRNLVLVLSVQVIALVLLWLLQRAYTS